MKKTLSIILIIMLVGTMLVSCSGDDAPDGMKSATAVGEPFILYVPQSFIDNTSSGISSAYLEGIDSSITVSARYYTPSEEMTLESYMNKCTDSYNARLESFRKTSEIVGDTLDGKDARRLEYIFTKDGVSYTAVQRTVAFGGDFVSLNIYTAGNNIEELYGEYLTAIVENFRLVERDGTDNVFLTDKKTPEGMRIASSDIVEYRLYVPENWVCNPNSGASEAYHPETMANVTVTSFSPTDEVKGKTLSEYADYCVAEYEKTVGGFDLVEKVASDVKVAGKDAMLITFTAEYEGVSYKLRQIVFHAREYDLYYSITYTATSDSFDAHLDDLSAMISAFCFR